MKKTFLLIHKWLGIVFGVFISIACFTGAILLFRSEICQWLGVEMRDAEFFRWVMRLHRWLLDTPSQPHGGLSVGRVIMGITAIACTLTLITGVVVWWPKNMKMLRVRLTVKLRSGWMRFVHDTHVSLGIYAVVFLLLMSLTGPVWSFQWYRSGATSVICAGTAPGEAKPAGGSEVTSQPRESGIRSANQEQPSGRQEQVVRDESAGTHSADGRHSSGADQSVNPAARHEHEQGQGRVQGRGQGHDGGHSGVQGEGHGQGQGKGHGHGGNKSSAQKTFISLHLGTWGGTVMRVIYLLSALIGGFLPISGYYIWLKKHSLKRSGKIPPHH